MKPPFCVCGHDSRPHLCCGVAFLAVSNHTWGAQREFATVCLGLEKLVGTQLREWDQLSTKSPSVWSARFAKSTTSNFYLFLLFVFARGESWYFLWRCRLGFDHCYSTAYKTRRWRGAGPILCGCFGFYCIQSTDAEGQGATLRDTQYGDCGCDQLFLWYRAHTCQWRQGAIVNHSIYNTSELPHYTIVS